MTGTAIDAMRADRDELLSICERLSEADWKTESGCAGWSVQDLVAHMATLYWVVVDPSTLPDTTGVPTEQAQEINVESRRSWSADRVVEDYRTVSAQAIDAMAMFEGQDFEVPLGDLGTYPAGVLPNAFSFDHYLHIRADLFAPRGPLPDPVPPSDELRLAPALDWIEAALPQQNAELVSSLPGAVALVETGPGGRTIIAGSGPAVAEVSSDSDSFLRWITQRGAWESLGVAASGDPDALAAVQKLKVF
jgi:uncharacterized protein (TIGR03083 family)